MGDRTLGRGRALIATIATVAVPAMAVRVLHGMGSDARIRLDLGDPFGWISRATPIDAVSAVLRLGGLLLAYYVLVSTVAYLVALAVGNRRAVEMVRPFTLPLVRTIADRLIAGTIAVSALAAPLLGSADPPPTEPPSVQTTLTGDILAGYVHAMYQPPAEGFHESSVDSAQTDIASGYAGRPTTPLTNDLSSPVVDIPAEGTPAEIRSFEPGSVVVVRKGESLWSIAADSVSHELGHPPSDNEVAPYWRKIIDHNRHRLRSGNPDLIFPGEEIELPRAADHAPGG